MSEDIRWEVVEESALTLTDHEAIAAMLAQAFPSWSHWYVGGRSWSGMQPERRVLGRTEDGVVLARCLGDAMAAGGAGEEKERIEAALRNLSANPGPSYTESGRGLPT